ncbi:hypothetical protein [Pueribacillus theae]|nr:hypothetical protein [Pueribacillus theae]
MKKKFKFPLAYQILECNYFFLTEAVKDLEKESKDIKEQFFNGFL